MPRILLDLDPDLRRDLFDDTRLGRLAEVGELMLPDRRLDDGARLEYEIVITGWGSAPFPLRRSGDAPLALVAHTAGTIRKLVSKELLSDGVRVTQAASGMAVSVAECALYMTISLMRNLQQVDRNMERRDWPGALGFGLGSTIAGSRIGVVGASRVGRAYIEHIVSMGADVHVYDPYLTQRDAADLGVSLADLDELMSYAPVLALHAPVTEETRGMISADRLAALPDGAIVVNTARSAIIDMPALVRELRSGRLSAALDVYDVEPLPADYPLWGLPNVLLTPHLGAVTTHSRQMQGEIVVDEVERFASNGSLVFEVTPASYDRLA